MEFSLTKEQERRREDIIRFAQTELNHGTISAIRVFGGSGYLSETMASPIYSSTSDIQRNIIARWLGP